MSLESICRRLHLLGRGQSKALGLDGKSRDEPDSMILTGEISPDPVMYMRRWEKADETRLTVLEDTRQAAVNTPRKRPT
jgi:hypothetical protein